MPYEDPTKATISPSGHGAVQVFILHQTSSLLMGFDLCEASGPFVACLPVHAGAAEGLLGVENNSPDTCRASEHSLYEGWERGGLQSPPWESTYSLYQTKQCIQGTLPQIKYGNYFNQTENKQITGKNVYPWNVIWF